ncbi:AfsR/SARP family transcriptional regulator [Actinospica robiniae]|uniref:AfsR/SARP family transcriptional regulator n=1 Tax=Actinospica robiniae TaxID=304901 RepID=UPI0003F649FE|nr:BTAD domain-containing putative transcriptional regulator [Actinospica robiniae]
MLRFGLLGPVEVFVDGRELRLAHGKQRDLLALLLLRPNRVRTTDELIQRLWPASRPDNAVNALHTHVLRLRRQLGNVAGERIETRAPGYRILVAPGELDLDEYRRWHEMCESDAKSADWSSLLDHAQSALRLWRGNPFLDVSTEIGDSSDAALLREERLCTELLRIRALVELGSFASAAARARPLLDEHPFHERLAGLYISALAQDGRRTEALEAYQRTSSTYFEHLGVAPGADLQRLHRTVLDGAVSPAPALS